MFKITVRPVAVLATLGAFALTAACLTPAMAAGTTDPTAVPVPTASPSAVATETATANPTATAIANPTAAPTSAAALTLYCDYTGGSFYKYDVKYGTPQDKEDVAITDSAVATDRTKATLFCRQLRTDPASVGTYTGGWTTMVGGNCKSGVWWSSEGFDPSYLIAVRFKDDTLQQVVPDSYPTMTITNPNGTTEIAAIFPVNKWGKMPTPAGATHVSIRPVHPDGTAVIPLIDKSPQAMCTSGTPALEVTATCGIVNIAALRQGQAGSLVAKLDGETVYETTFDRAKRTGDVVIPAKDGTLVVSTSFPDGEQFMSTTVEVTDCPKPSIDIEKFINGDDADEAPGVDLGVEGAPMTFTFEVTNTGNTTLTNVAVTDDVLGAVTCPKTELAAGEKMTCDSIERPTLPFEGTHRNVATVTGTYPGRELVGLKPVDVTDSDEANAMRPAEPVTPSPEPTPTEPTVTPNDPQPSTPEEPGVDQPEVPNEPTPTPEQTTPDQPVAEEPDQPAVTHLAETGGEPLLPLAAAGASLALGAALLRRRH